MITKSYHDTSIGECYVSDTRTISEADVTSFSSLTRNWFAIHTDPRLAERTEFGQRIVHGSLVLSLIGGLLPLNPEYVVALYGMDRFRFLRPVFIGDSIHVEAEISGKTDRDAQRGLVEVSVQVKNQRDQMVQAGVMRFLVRNQALSAGSAPTTTASVQD